MPKIGVERFRAGSCVVIAACETKERPETKARIVIAGGEALESATAFNRIAIAQIAFGRARFG